MKEDFNALRLKHHGDAVKMNVILQKKGSSSWAMKGKASLKN